MKLVNQSSCVLAGGSFAHQQLTKMFKKETVAFAEIIFAFIIDVFVPQRPIV
jgi:hypothetical protein